MARIAVGGFQHETNTFAPQRATWADFERSDAWPPFVRGAELIDAVAGYNIPIAGAVDALRTRGHELFAVVLVLGTALRSRRARGL
jgi:microcystin degradation protein MlrC